MFSSFGLDFLIAFTGPEIDPSAIIPFVQGFTRKCLIEGMPIKESALRAVDGNDILGYTDVVVAERLSDIITARVIAPSSANRAWGLVPICAVCAMSHIRAFQRRFNSNTCKIRCIQCGHQKNVSKPKFVEECEKEAYDRWLIKFPLTREEMGIITITEDDAMCAA